MSWNEQIQDMDLEGWLAQYTAVKSGGGHEIRLQECPECGNDKFKLYVNTSKCLWVCYVCDWGRGLADVTRLMAAVSGRSLTSVRLEVQALALPHHREAEESDDQTLVAAPAVKAIQLPGEPLESMTGITGQRIQAYATQRGLTAADLARIQPRGAFKLPTPTGYEVKGPWLVFPAFQNHRAVAWQGRRLTGGDPKYLSSKSVKQTLFPLDPVTWDLYQSTSERAVYLVEGPFDALGMQRMGFPALATFGKSLSQAQVELLMAMRPKEIVFVWDYDAPDETRRAAKMLPYALIPTTAVSLARDDDTKVDPGDALTDSTKEWWLRERIRVPREEAHKLFR